MLPVRCFSPQLAAYIIVAVYINNENATGLPFFYMVGSIFYVNACFHAAFMLPDKPFYGQSVAFSHIMSTSLLDVTFIIEG